jgi:drug/metabolite transporter (DMT)-like permease
MLPILLAIGAGLCWGIGELATKSVLHAKTVGPLTAVAVRTTVALPIVWAAALCASHILKWKSEPTNWWAASSTPTLAKLFLGSGLFAGAIAVLLFYAALNVGEIGRVKPIAFALAPAFAALLGWLILGEPMTTKKIAGIALMLTGLVVITWK